MTARNADQPVTMRERYRSQVRDEVKQIALRQLAELGPGGLSVSAIGKELGVSGPALYRYFASRDELLTELVIDAYNDLADALSAATRDVPSRTPRARFEALARKYRSWALAQPHRYRLLYGPPLPAYDAHAQRLVDASQQAMNLLIDTLPDVASIRLTRSNRPLGSELSHWARRQDLDIKPAIALTAILIWTRVHGFISLEIAGAFSSMGIDPDSIFEIELSNLAT